MIETLTDQERIFFKNHGMVMLKPDAIELFLENMFIRDLEEMGFIIMYRQFLLLSESDLIFIYPEWVSNGEKFAAIKANMTEGHSMLLILKYSGETNTYGYLQGMIKLLKGRANKPGLRNKYIHVFEEELLRHYPQRDQFLKELNKNRIHPPDTPQEVLNTLVYLYPRLRRENVSSTAPGLCDIITERLRITLMYDTR